MAINELRCPSCGADVSFDGDADIECPYCGSKLHFKELAEKAELDRLKAENAETEIRQGNKRYHKKSIEKWKKGNRNTFIIMGAANTLGVALAGCEYETGAFIIVFVLAFFMIAPAYLCLTYPCFDEKKGEPVYSRKQIFSQMLRLYGKALGVLVLTFSIGILIAAAIHFIK